MMKTRLLTLLGLLQARRLWSGQDLAERLSVSHRTLRRDVDALRELGYPVLSARGTGGGYQLGSGAALPPLVLSEEEAAATVLGLRDVSSGNHAIPAEAAITAIAKLVQVLPERIRGRITSLASLAGPEGQHGGTLTDVTVLTTLALACRDSDTVEFAYQSVRSPLNQRTTQPHRIVTVDQRLYLLAWDLRRNGWRTFRIDRIGHPRRTGKRFAQRTLPSEDPVTFVRDQLGAMPARYRVHATVSAPAGRVRELIAHYGAVTERDERSCELVIAAESLDWAAFCLGSLDAPFTVHGPPEACETLRVWGKRLLEGTAPAPKGDTQDSNSAREAAAAT